MQLKYTVNQWWEISLFICRFFQQAQDYADGNNIVEIFMEVSALTGENVEDLFSEIGEQD